ncbi:hypothetical protein E7T09_15835 [Deinococcus sp. KSM4-11]|uniref:hypothetical protein n=1 Tax=Deinococcus sp. KSM4-11 TaxID=2568654 RepID=UPI0010A43FA9|nr:hypothetical protein [Deinococcus sp. KSM4-11]THF85437.1 hypothetical protein E7T09_15835 [Deinococcus sp. KSM4-11]
MARSITQVLNALQSLDPVPGLSAGETPLPLRHTLTAPSDASDLAVIHHVPAALHNFWLLAASARLFEDMQYGQWGLVIHDPCAARHATDAYQLARYDDARAGDLVVGMFLGDCDLLIVRPDPKADDEGQVLVALPLDGRVDGCVALTGITPW